MIEDLLVPSVTYQVKIITSTEEFAILEKTWNKLLSSSPADNYFLRWEWLWNWWQVYSNKGDELRIIIIERGDGIVGIAPFYSRKRLLGRIFPVRRMMFLGTQENGEGDVCSDYMNAIYKEGEAQPIIERIFETITGNNLCDEIYLSKINKCSETFPLLKKEAEKYNYLLKIDNEFSSPYIRLPKTWDEYMKTLSKSMRYNIRNERKKLQNYPQIQFKRIEQGKELESGYNELVRLHQSRWETRGYKGSFADKRFKMFHYEMMRMMMENGLLQLWFLSDQGTNYAAIYNISYNKKIYFYQSGIDLKEKRAAWGILLISHCIEEAIQQRMEEYDFLPKGGNDDYKDRFAKDHREVVDIYLASHWLVKNFVTTTELARTAYHRFKPYLIYARKKSGN